MNYAEEHFLRYIYVYPEMFNNVPSPVLIRLRDLGYIDIGQGALTEKGQEWNYEID